MSEWSQYDELFKGKVYEILTFLTKADEDKVSGIISFEDWTSIVEQKMIYEMPKLEVNEKENDGEAFIVSIDFDRKLRIIRKGNQPGTLRLSPNGVRLLQQFLSDVYR